MKKHQKLLCLMACIAMIASIAAGCGGSSNKGAESTAGSTSATASTSVSTQTQSANDFASSVLELSFMAINIPQTPVLPQEDVTSAEITQRTGIKWKSIEGLSGQDYTSKLNLLIQSDSLPDVIVGPIDPRLWKNQAIWPIKYNGLLKQYAPEVYKRIDADALPSMLQNDDDFYGFPTAMTQNSYDKQNSPTMYTAMGDWMEGKADFCEMYVRDDVLKKIYPDAKTYNEIADAYAAAKDLTADAPMVAGLETGDDFLGFLSKVKALGLKENGNDVIPFLLNDRFIINNYGYPALMELFGYVGGNYATGFYSPFENNYVLSQTQPGFKEALKKWNGAIRAGLCDWNALVMKPEQLTQKVLKGEYASLWHWFDGATTDLNALNKACDDSKKPYHYRMVYLKPQITKYNAGQAPCSPSASSYYMINKKTVKESDLPKLANYYNFFLTKEGAELIAWGPESAGLWTVGADGKKHFKDKDLENSAVNWDTKKGVKNCQYYNLVNGTYDASANFVFYAIGNEPMSPYMPRVEAWPLPKTGLLTELNALLENQFGGTRNRYYLDATDGASFPPDDPRIKTLTDANGKWYADFTAATNNILPKLIFSRSDNEFESNYKKLVDTILGNGDWENYRKLKLDMMTEWLAKHPDIKPKQWSVDK